MIYVDDWFIPLTRSARTTYMSQLTEEIEFPSPELSFASFTPVFHPSSDKLFNLILRARPEHATTETMNILKTYPRCDPCQHSPRTYEGIRFSAAYLLRDISTEAIWDSLLQY
eukprot:IDg7693t1